MKSDLKLRLSDSYDEKGVANNKHEPYIYRLAGYTIHKWCRKDSYTHHLIYIVYRKFH